MEDSDDDHQFAKSKLRKTNKTEKTESTLSKKEKKKLKKSKTKEDMKNQTPINENTSDVTSVHEDADAVPNIPTQNQFEAIKDMVDKQDNTQINPKLIKKPKHQGKPPPLILQGRKYTHKSLMDTCEAYANQDFDIKYTKNSTIIITKTQDAYRNIQTQLNKDDAHYYTYTPKNEKQHGFVLKGLQDAPTIDEIKSHLMAENIPIIQIYKMKNISADNYIVITEGNITLAHLQSNIKAINHTIVHWERHRNQKVMIQCRRCQAWGHAQSNCYLTPKCLKCAQNHLTYACDIKEKTEETTKRIKCANCAGNHPANSVECQSYLDRLNYINNKKAHTQAEKQKQPQYKPAPLPASNPWARQSQHNTYQQDISGFPPLRGQVKAQIPKNPIFNNEADYQHILTNNVPDNNPKIIPNTSGLLNELASEFKILNANVNLVNLLSAVKDLNNQLKGITDPMAKIIIMNSFAQTVNKYDI